MGSILIYIFYVLLVVVAFNSVGKMMPKANLKAFRAYKKLKKENGEQVTKESIKEVQLISTAMGIKFTAPKEAMALKYGLPKAATRLKAKAKKAESLYSNLRKYAKTTAVLAGIGIFGYLYEWWLPSVIATLKASSVFLLAVVCSLPFVAAGVALFLIAAYIFKVVGPRRKAKYNKTAIIIENQIPEAEEDAALLS